MPKTDLARFEGDPEFMMSLARGLAVMRRLAAAERPLGIAELSRQLALSRTAVGRCLYTLGALGYVARSERGYVIQGATLALGSPHLSVTPLAARSQPLLDKLRTELGESCSLGVLENDELCYVARAEASRIMSITLRVGSRLPLYATSMGRVLLAGRSEAERQGYVERTPLRAHTPRTVTDAKRLLATIRRVASDGYAIVDQELEIGLRSIAVPVAIGGVTAAALNVGASASRISLDDMRGRVLPALRRVAARLGH